MILGRSLLFGLRKHFEEIFIVMKEWSQGLERDIKPKELNCTVECIACLGQRDDLYVNLRLALRVL